MADKGIYQQTYRQILWILIWSEKFTIQALYGRSTGNPLTTFEATHDARTEIFTNNRFLRRSYRALAARRQVSGLDKR